MSGTEAAETVGKTDAAGTAGDSSSSSSSSDEGRRSWGAELLKIPCMRSSLLNGYIGAVVGGLVGFFYTSNIRIGAHSAFASYWVTATGSWVTCRHRHDKEQKMWSGIIEKVNEYRSVKKNEYNLPEGLKKPGDKTDGPDNTSANHG